MKDGLITQVKKLAAERGVILDPENPITPIGLKQGKLAFFLNPIPQEINIEFRIEAENEN